MIKQINTLLTSFLPKETWKSTLLEEWTIIMGDLSGRVTLEKIYNDTLVIGVRDAAWLQELYMLSPVIIENINAHLDQPRIKQLRFKQVVKKNRPHVTVAKKKEEARPIILNPQEEKTLQTINDEELRHALKNFLIRCYRERV